MNKKTLQLIYDSLTLILKDLRKQKDNTNGPVAIINLTQAIESLNKTLVCLELTIKEIE